MITIVFGSLVVLLTVVGLEAMRYERRRSNLSPDEERKRSSAPTPPRVAP